MKSFIIRIEGHPLSTQLAKDAYDTCVSASITPEYFNAIVPATLGNFFATNPVSMSAEFLTYSKDNGPRTQACFASHYLLWKKCVELNEKIIIMEHDGYMLNPVTDIVDQVEDVCHLDPSRKVRFNTYPYYLAITEPRGVLNDFDNPEQYLPNPYKEQRGSLSPIFFRGAYAYILTPSGANKLINHVNTHGASGADRNMAKNVLRLQITNVSYARLNPIFKKAIDVQTYSTRAIDGGSI